MPARPRRLPIHERLRGATAEPHRRLDRGLRYVLGEGLSSGRYARLLVALYGFYVPLEAALARLQAGPGLPLLQRTPLLERDLRALGADPARAPLCARPPRLESDAQLAGALYVVEGACLGGQVIARAVSRRLGVGPERGAAFFSGEGPRTAARWSAVLAWLEARGGEAGADAIAEGACRTFGALSLWLSARGVLHGHE